MSNQTSIAPLVITQIDPGSEALLTLSQAAAELPRRRKGKKPSLSCMYRWTTTGCRGVVLESIQVGGTRATSREALARFMHRLSLPPEQRGGIAPVPSLRSSGRRLRDSQRAAGEEARGA